MRSAEVVVGSHQGRLTLRSERGDLPRVLDEGGFEVGDVVTLVAREEMDYFRLVEQLAAAFFKGKASDAEAEELLALLATPEETYGRA